MERASKAYVAIIIIYLSINAYMEEWNHSARRLKFTGNRVISFRRKWASRNINSLRKLDMDVPNFSLLPFSLLPIINEKNMSDCIILFSPVHSTYTEKNYFSMTIREKEEDTKKMKIPLIEIPIIEWQINWTMFYFNTLTN